MPTAVEDIVARIDENLVRLGEEVKRLEDAKAKLVNGDQPAAEAPKKKRTAKRSTLMPEIDAALGRSERVRAGGRGPQALEVIGERPGISSVDLGRALGVGGTQAYGIVGRLAKRGAITGDHRGWTVK